MTLQIKLATMRDAAQLVKLHTAVAEHLTEQFGVGAWSSKTSEKGVLYALRNMKVYVVRDEREIVATLRLATKKPWAIDTSYFTPCKKPLYLLNMAVVPNRQRQGIGRWCLAEAVKLAKDWPAEAIRLDAYDAQAGAGEFYARCGYKERGKATYKNTPLIYYEMMI